MNRRSARRVVRAGFTLTELMVVVVIIGVLAMISVPTFRRYIHRARATEGTAFLQEIRGREETYKVDNGRYASGGPNPASVPAGGNTVPWNRTSADWIQLGAAPDTVGVRFQYQIEVGTPDAGPPGLGYDDGVDFWFVSKATADLDGDGATFFLEGYSFAAHMYSSSAEGFE